MSKIAKYRSIILEQESLAKTYHIKVIKEGMSYEEFETVCAVNKMDIQELVARMQAPAEA